MIAGRNYGCLLRLALVVCLSLAMKNAKKCPLNASSADEQAEPMDADTPDEGDEVSAEDTGSL